jgi:hypothetical protein
MYALNLRALDDRPRVEMDPRGTPEDERRVTEVNLDLIQLCTMPAPLDPLDQLALQRRITQLFPTLSYPVRYRESHERHVNGVFLDDIEGYLRSLGYKNFRLVWDERHGAAQIVAWDDARKQG